jgi:hypothetical protein
VSGFVNRAEIVRLCFGGWIEAVGYTQLWVTPSSSQPTSILLTSNRASSRRLRRASSVSASGSPTRSPECQEPRLGALGGQPVLLLLGEIGLNKLY